MDGSDDMSFGETLRMFRERQHPKISQQKLAEALGLDRQPLLPGNEVIIYRKTAPA